MLSGFVLFVLAVLAIGSLYISSQRREDAAFAYGLLTLILAGMFVGVAMNIQL